jgi:hypothetical protein
MKRTEFHTHLAKVWTRIEELLQTNKLVNVYIDHLEATAQNVQNDEHSKEG